MNYQFLYSQKPIASLETLAIVLNSSVNALQNIAASPEKFYREIPVLKEDGSQRITYNIQYPLKLILQTLRNRIISSVEMPFYIMAGQKGKSYLTNADNHTTSNILVSEDITNFFPSISQKRVEEIFQFFFKFSPDVSNLLAKLCTYKGSIPQGSPISGDMANLVFYDREPKIVEDFANRGYRYTRFYDDITVSAQKNVSKEEITYIKATIIGMFKSLDLEPNRKKSTIVSSKDKQTVHNVVVNQSSVKPNKRTISIIRSEIHKFDQAIKNNNLSIEKIINRFRSLNGKIRHLQNEGYKKYERKQAHLEKSLTYIAEDVAIKFCRGIRKARNRRQYNQLRNSLSILSKISPRVCAIAEAESKSALNKIRRKEGKSR